ncbi:unnamed protein product [[Actinomadura] parvosata subsp. kistnae]|uniref:DUF2203 domain-containing protein n=1 Tax=[Actinomadura] parvosata subsp. kistnae TaxID=1909395 RepID=A0A1U9ZS18_9ACTN|nr:DUF2203 domain-containing protein [Nonomuraea sp. ATCC 55076]AQZ60745.1 hypothetical protein BKM31_03790 [Nonomuraea sp. ATCC 55076]SPL90635.1 unnamed protein product [Actinomadura parvosata subsp. kistnae]
MERIFTLDEARALLPAVMREAAELIAARADLAEIDFERRTGGRSELGGLPELKGLQARIEEILSGWSEQGIEVKGIAPVLVDFPSLLDGVSVRLCWIEGERELGWYHRTELGFAGRRPL